MKTLILYATTYGFTKDCALELKEYLQGEVNMVNINSSKELAIEEFETIIIGGSIYVGQLNKKLKSYCTDHKEELMKKRLAFFLCSGMADQYEQNLANSYPEELLQKAVSIKYFGGELRMEKMKFFHKAITKLIKKATEKEKKPEPCKLRENIIKLADDVNSELKRG